MKDVFISILSKKNYHPGTCTGDEQTNSELGISVDQSFIWPAKRHYNGNKSYSRENETNSQFIVS
jgi:hypothetical protein